MALAWATLTVESIVWVAITVGTVTAQIVFGIIVILSLIMTVLCKLMRRFCIEVWNNLGDS